MVGYVDCEGCGCLIRAEESACPFCDRRGGLIPGGALKFLGLVVAGLSLGTVSCVSEDGSGDSISGDEDDADAVTYAGPDDASITETDSQDSVTYNPTDADASTYAGPDDESSSVTQDSVTYDPTDADAVTYAGPDESSSTDATVTDTETSSGTDTTTDTGTDTGETDTGSTGTDDGEPTG